MFGEKKRENYKIILNGADASVFFPNKNKDAAHQMKFITTGNFRNDDMLVPLINAMDIVFEKRNDIVLRIVGPVRINKKEEVLKRSYIEYYDEKSLHEIAELLRDSDVFIYSHLNPPCPNSVIEAVSCGLPVVGFKSGAMEEMCYFNEELLAFVSDDVFQKYEDLNPELLAEKIILCLSEFKRFKENALKHHENFSMDQCAGSYMDVFQEVLDQKRGNMNFLRILSSMMGRS
jgi:glycosyltransferase involved in cell wall biosynthesis